MCIDIGAANGYNLWTVGTWDGNNWSCPFDEIGYTVVEWYELPPQKRTDSGKLFLSSNKNGIVLDK